MLLDDYKRALYDFSAAILNETRYNSSQKYQVKSPDSLAHYYTEGGICNYYLGQFEEALAHYEIAIKKEEMSGSKDNVLLGKIYYNKGLALSSLKRFDAAIEAQN